MKTHSYIVAAKRSPVAPRDGGLSALTVHQLAAPIVRALMNECEIDAQQVDMLIAGNALGAGGNPARVVALASCLGDSNAGLSVDTQCCSGLDSILIANDMICSGRASVIIAGGVESYSQRPLRYRVKADSKEYEAYEQPAFTPWPERDPDMAEAADALAEKLGITFEQQNQWAIDSHQRALLAKARMLAEIVPLNKIESDSYTRKLSEAVCHRATRIQGSVSVANTAVAADAAAFCMVVSEAVAKQIGGPQLCIRTGTTRGADPLLPGLAPVAAIKSVLTEQGMQAVELNRTEIMEAFAVQAIACVEQCALDPLNCNVGGGGLARGHPIGASGAILMTRLFHELQLCGGRGLAAIAAAGGLGTAVLVESNR